MRRIITLRTLATLPLTALLLAASLSTAQAQPPANPGNGNPPAHAGEGRGLGRQAIETGRSSFKGILRTAQHIYYEGDDLDIRVKFPRGSDLLASGEADAHVVIYSHDRTVTSVPVEHDIGADERMFFSIENIDTDTLPEGQYQLGLVVTVPDGDPLLLEDWYSGFRGLLDVRSIFVSAQALEDDADGDGEWDDDDDGDGISDDDDIEDDEDDE